MSVACDNEQLLMVIWIFSFFPIGFGISTMSQSRAKPFNIHYLITIILTTRCDAKTGLLLNAEQLFVIGDQWRIQDLRLRGAHFFRN